MSGTFDDAGSLDPTRPIIVLCTGRKGSGKSVMGKLIFQGFPGDRVVIDVAQDDGPWGPDVIELRGPVDELPAKWPEDQRQDGKRMTLRYVPTPGSSTYLQDCDRIVGMAMHHGDCAILIHEVRRVVPAGKTQPHMAALLDHSRHARVTAIFCGPRPMTIDPLVVAQADLVYIFETRGVHDKNRLSDEMGWDLQQLSAAIAALGPHEYLRYDGNEPPPEPGDKDLRLTHWDALPPDVVAQVERWSKGGAQPDATPARPLPRHR